jgi:hypothetical protein
MRVRVSQPHLLPDLFEFLERRANLVVCRVGEDAVDVGVLGSFADGGFRELHRYLAEWQAERSTDGVAIERRNGSPQQVVR